MGKGPDPIVPQGYAICYMLYKFKGPNSTNKSFPNPNSNPIPNPLTKDP